MSTEGHWISVSYNVVDVSLMTLKVIGYMLVGKAHYKIVCMI